MKQDLLIVIDMQNVYGPGGEWCCAKSKDAAQNILKLVHSDREKFEVVYTRFLAPEHPVGVWKDYNIEYAVINADEYGNAMMDEFIEEAGMKDPLYTKSTYSSMSVPELREKAESAEHVMVCGVVAECCVLATAMELIDMGASVIYLTDAVAGFSDETEAAVETILAGLEPLHVRRMTVEQYLSE